MMRISLGHPIIGVYWMIGTLSGASILEKITVCEVLADPLKYNGKMILLEGETQYSGGFASSGAGFTEMY